MVNIWFVFYKRGFEFELGIILYFKMYMVWYDNSNYVVYWVDEFF